MTNHSPSSNADSKPITFKNETSNDDFATLAIANLFAIAT